MASRLPFSYLVISPGTRNKTTRESTICKLNLKTKTEVNNKTSGGHIESDISNIDIFVNIDIVSKKMRKYRYFDISYDRPKTKQERHKKS